MMSLFRRFIVNPQMIGAVMPSSYALSCEMTRQVGTASAVFEIGAGTGAITRLIPYGALAHPLVVFEQDKSLADCLQRQISYAKIIVGLFHEKIYELGEIPENLVILSSVPFRALSKRTHYGTVDALCRILRESPSRRLVQYTYLNRPPFIPHCSGLRWHLLSHVWANIPPATVWELRADAKPPTELGISNVILGCAEQSDLNEVAAGSICDPPSGGVSNSTTNTELLTALNSTNSTSAGVAC